MWFISSPERLRRAARRCMRRAASPGSDGMTWAQYRSNMGDRLARLAKQLAEDTWRPKPPRLVEIEDFGGKRFTIVVPTVEERIVHRILREGVETVVEPGGLCSFVHGYRPHRNRVTAVRQAAELLRQNSFVFDADIEKVSAGGTVDSVIDSVARFISDGEFLLRVRRALNGLPEPLMPGSGIAPLLINLRLTPVDLAISHLKVVRFSDNYCLFAERASGAEAARERLLEALAVQGLRVAKKKCRMRAVPNPEDLFLICG
jgi:RNA-directed DNA polymerase